MSRFTITVTEQTGAVAHDAAHQSSGAPAAKQSIAAPAATQSVFAPAARQSVMARQSAPGGPVARQSVPAGPPAGPGGHDLAPLA